MWCLGVSALVAGVMAALVVILTAVLSCVSGEPGKADGIGSAAQLTLPSSVALWGRTRLLVADTGNNAVRAIHLATKSVSFLVGPACPHLLLLLRPAALRLPPHHLDMCSRIER